MSTSTDYVLTPDNINQNVHKMEYAIVGPVSLRAKELVIQLKKGDNTLGFNKIIETNSGDCHAVGQKPISFLRQVLACTVDPSLIEKDIYPEDVKERAKLLLDNCSGRSVGSYSRSYGIEIVRKHVAEYIQERDGYDSDWQNIIMTGGGRDALSFLLEFVSNRSVGEKPVGVIVPVPEYPIYSAIITEFDLYKINYYLDEQNEWALNINELERSLNEAKQHSRPRVLVVINPSNPTGSVLTKENIIEIIQFARRNNLMIIADEVYQHNVYDENSKFHSFKKIMCELGIKLELASLMSLSKGYMGECGFRQSYLELCNFDPKVRKLFLKLLDVRLCGSTLGQIALDVVVKEPKIGQPSYELFKKEKEGILNSLKQKAQIVEKAFKEIPGLECNKISSSMYAYPRIHLPEKAIEKAKSLNLEPDSYYALRLLEETGISLIPGSGFGQKVGTYHFRTTILPQEDEMKDMVARLAKFHSDFLNEFK